MASDAGLGNSSGTVTINNGAWDIQNGATSSRPIVVNSANNSIIQVDSGTFTAAGPISGSGALTIQGNGTFATAGTISQGVVLNGGNLAIGTTSVTGTLGLSSGLTVNSGSLTFKLQNNGNSDAIDLSSGAARAATLDFANTGTVATVTLTSVPLPDTNQKYFLITGDYSNQGKGNGYISTDHLPLNCALGFSGSWNIDELSDADHNKYASYYVTLTGPTQWQAAGGALSNNSNWTNNAPSNPGGIGLFGGLGSGTVSLPGGGYSLHGLIFSNTGSSYTLTSAGTADALSLTGVYNAGGYTGMGEVEVVSGSHDILAPLVLAANTDVTMYDPASSLGIAGAVSGTGSLTLAGSGLLILEGADTYSGGTTVAGGELYLTTSQSLLDGSSLVVGGGGTLIFDPTAAGSPLAASAASGPGSAAQTASPVPEPGTLAILAVGALACLAARGWRRVRQAFQPDYLMDSMTNRPRGAAPCGCLRPSGR